MILPFEINPYVKSYHCRAFPLGVIQGNAKKDITPWLCSKYINCVFDPNSYGMKFDIGVFDPWGNKENVTSSQSIILDQDMYKVLGLDKLFIVKKLIDNGYYVHGGFNEKYIPSKHAYQKYDCPHDYMIIGYDDVDKKMFCVGYTSNNIYEVFEVSYTDYLKSIDGKQTEINTCRFNFDYEFKLNVTKTIQELNDYLLSKNSNDNCFSYKKYGIKAIKELQQYFIEKAEKDQYFDIRYARSLLEHRYIMNIRINYLTQHVISNDQLLTKEIKKTLDYANQVFLLGIKYKMNKDKQLIYKIISLIDKIIEIDNVCIPKMIELLVNSNG